MSADLSIVDLPEELYEEARVAFERAASIVLKHLGSCPIWMKPSVTPGFDFEMFDVDIVYYLGSKEDPKKANRRYWYKHILKTIELNYDEMIHYIPTIRTNYAREIAKPLGEILTESRFRSYANVVWKDSLEHSNHPNLAVWLTWENNHRASTKSAIASDLDSHAAHFAVLRMLDSFLEFAHIAAEHYRTASTEDINEQRINEVRPPSYASGAMEELHNFAQAASHRTCTT